MGALLGLARSPAEEAPAAQSFHDTAVCATRPAQQTRVYFFALHPERAVPSGRDGPGYYLGPERSAPMFSDPEALHREA